MTTQRTLPLADSSASQRQLVGGKGANLALLLGAGFPVPDGFCVTSAAHAEFLDSAGLREGVQQLTAGIDRATVEELDHVCEQVRKLILAAPLPAELAAEIATAYANLSPGGDAYVAVRSSGTAEDSGDASFAGLHDTLLDVRGGADVEAAVRACWASMWNPRATAYRHMQGIPHDEAVMAVVVQVMVESSAAGVLFTANPATADTDEFVLNASWGLGEAVVSGRATPDQWLLAASDLHVREKSLGEKQIRIVRDPVSGKGTVEKETPAAEREVFCLTDDQARRLAALGRKVQDHYQGVPQDLEWALVDGDMVLLQSRPVTGVAFTWADDLDAWQTAPDDDDYVWTREWADAYQSGALSPLFYTIRNYTCTEANYAWANTLGIGDQANLRNFKFHHSTLYFNCEVDRQILQASTPPMFRPALAEMIPPSWREEVTAAPFSWLTFLKQHARIEALTDQGLLRWFGLMENYLNNEVEYANGLPDAELALLSDQELRQYCDRYVEYERQYLTDAWTGFMTHGKETMSLLGALLHLWYPGFTPSTFADVIAGSITPTATQIENHHLWQMSRTIRSSARLQTLFEDHPGAGFFDAVRRDGSTEAIELAAQYQVLLDQSGHRGSADRDIIFPTRCEDASNDYAALKALLTAPDDADPAQREHEVNAKRDALMASVLAEVHRQPFGFLKVEALSFVHRWVMRFNAIRDDERHFFDRFMFTIRRGFLEVGRRLTERGVLTCTEDVFFLGREELWVLLGGVNSPLTAVKVANRRADFERVDTKQYRGPTYLHRGRPADALSGAQADPDGLVGSPISNGTVTATARVIRSLGELGRVQSGDILVVNATDPAWTSAFLIVSGVIVETGGLLSHAACLAREYGLPAVRLPGALERIPDGALVTVHGDTGVLILVEDAAAPVSVTPL